MPATAIAKSKVMIVRKFFNSEHLRFFVENETFRFSSNKYFAREFSERIRHKDQMAGPSLISDFAEGFHVNFIDLQSNGNAFINNVVEIEEKPTFYMLSFYNGTTDDGRKIFVDTSPEAGGPGYDCCLEIRDLRAVLQAIFNEGKIIIPDTGEEFIAEHLFERPRTGPVRYVPEQVKEFGAAFPKTDPFLKYENFLNQNEYRAVLIPKINMKEDYFYMRCPGLMGHVDRVVRF